MRFLLSIFVVGSLLGQAPEKPARITHFEAIPSTVNAGESVELRWIATGTEIVRLDPSGEDLPSQGSIRRVVKKRTVFWLHAISSKGGESVPLVVEVKAPAPTQPLRPEPSNAPKGAAAPRGSVPSHGVWVQFAAMAEERRALDLRNLLVTSTECAIRIFVTEAPNQPGLRLHRVRMGPFRSRAEARRQARHLAPKLAGFEIKPWITAE